MRLKRLPVAAAIASIALSSSAMAPRMVHARGAPPQAQVVAVAPADEVAAEQPPGAQSSPAPPPPAPDDAATVVVGALEVTGPLPEHWRTTIDTGLHRGLTRAGLGVAASATPMCVDLACLRAHARGGQSLAVIVAAVQSEDRFYRVRITAFDPAAGNPTELARVEEECPICGPGEVAALVERQATVLARKLPTTRMPGVLEVRSTPVGARIEVDGQVLGRAPLELELTAGEHTVRASADGYAPLERRVTATPRVRETWSPTLPKIEAPLDRRQESLRLGGWASIAGAGATVIPAIVFLALDRRPFPLSCSGRNVDADGDCRRLYNTLPHGATLLGVSAALVVTGAVLLSRSRRTNPTARTARLRPTRRGFSVAF